jgi:hypothetical protein
VCISVTSCSSIHSGRYHLYRKVMVQDGEEEMFFSMLSPLEWGGKPPNDYCDSYRLEYDMTWTQVGSP